MLNNDEGTNNETQFKRLKTGMDSATSPLALMMKNHEKSVESDNDGPQNLIDLNNKIKESKAIASGIELNKT